jgi:regulator of protease activity HflC (stomatin/prohibitin superfamily)
MELIAHLLEFIKSFWYNIIPFAIINEYEHGIILRLGKWHKNIEAGFIWKIPFFDCVMHCHNTVTTMAIKNQSLTTKDEHQITIETIVKYKISNAKKYLLEVEDSIDAINDITQGKIKELIINRNWEEVKSLKDIEIKDLVSKEASEWGIKIYYITITSLVKARVYKIINSNNYSNANH